MSIFTDQPQIFYKPSKPLRRPIQIYVSEDSKPQRYRIWTAPQSGNWTDKFSFYAYDSAQPGTTQYFVSDIGSPHRYRVSTSPQCCGWTDRFSFHAYESQQSGMAQYYVSDAGSPQRYQISKSSQSEGDWTDKFKFWAFDRADHTMHPVAHNTLCRGAPLMVLTKGIALKARCIARTRKKGERIERQNLCVRRWVLQADACCCFSYPATVDRDPER